MADQLTEQLENVVVSEQPEFEYLKKWLNHRRFEGRRTGRGFVTLDEYCKLIHFYKNWRRNSDEAILRYIAVSFTGRALTWWSNNAGKVTSLKELEEQLRIRFNQETEMTARIKFIRRRQRVDEPLLDYIDEQIYVARRVDDMTVTSERSIILMILVNIDKKYYNHFLESGLEFKTFEQFTKFAACLVGMLSSKDDEHNAQ